MTITKLHAAIAAAGLPVISVRKLGDGSFTADLDNGTPEQYAQAQAIIDGFDAAKEEHNAAVDAQIRGHEQRELAPRYSREAILVGILKDHMRDFSVTAATAIAELTTVGGPRYNAGFTKLKALDDQIKALRAQRQ